MTDFPKVRETDFVEREGVNHVASVVNRAHCVWREVLQRDIGIDGHVEYVDADGNAPGRLIAVQVKSGESRFTKATDTHVPFYPESKHRTYWAEHPLPVILVLHNPATEETVWVDAREALRVRPSEAAIQVPRAQALDADGVLRALQCAGPLPSGNTPVDEILRGMARPDAAAQGLCFLYLFTQGLTDLANSLYFSMDVLREVLDVLSVDWDPPAFRISELEFAFVDNYVAFLVRHDLARVDYGSWRQAILEREMVDSFIVPLTERGRAVRDAIRRIDDGLPQAEPEELQPYSHAIQERFVQMLYNVSGVDEVSVRQRRINAVQKEINSAHPI
ncbi:DUF4365 domain-containing protein [Isoptericola sp. QY 916]|uniref:DUF4365 domain-containing protein n=1 Tax=Isoptericola sp. QY 916 TaxID=2782570 RepID=UPI003D2FE6EC|nr:DUF4365 domain-containing protein [Isoptericola sp. QY 916]